MFIQEIEYTHQVITHLIDLLEKIIEHDEKVEQLTIKKEFLKEKKNKFQTFVQEQGNMDDDSHIVQELKKTGREITSTQMQIYEEKEKEQRAGIELFTIVRFSKDKEPLIIKELIRRKETMLRRNRDRPEIQKFVESIFKELVQIVVFLATIRNHAENILANITPLERTYEEDIMSTIGKGTLQSIGSKSTTIKISKIETGRRESTMKKARRVAARTFTEIPTQNLFIQSVEAYKIARDLGLQDEQLTPPYQELKKSIQSKIHNEQ
ncbi:hypothetical protein HY483_03130 [Candidatus Woesearchaeota archaeon]|nr:hypothetical protein [Candidatus Woesearchaeota archaeon]